MLLPLLYVPLCLSKSRRPFSADDFESAEPTWLTLYVRTFPWLYPPPTTIETCPGILRPTPATSWKLKLWLNPRERVPTRSCPTGTCEMMVDFPSKSLSRGGYRTDPWGWILDTHLSDTDEAGVLFNLLLGWIVRKVVRSAERTLRY